MDPIDSDVRKNALRRDIDRYRLAVARDLEGLHQALDIPSNLRSSISKHTPAWITGAGVLGFLLSHRRRRPKKSAESGVTEPVRRTARLALVGAILKWLFDTFRPLILELIRKKVVDISLRRV